MRFARHVLVLAISLFGVVLGACANVGELGEDCAESGSTGTQCEEGGICGAQGGKLVCLKRCTVNTDCASGTTCTPINGSFLKGCVKP
jgi:hypothetical protein